MNKIYVGRPLLAKTAAKERRVTRVENKLVRKYGLATAICMVVGVVIGSGVFFKAQNILEKTGGDMPLGIWAWVIGGAIMLCCTRAFSGMAMRYEKVNGIVDYAEATVGKRYAYYIGWFMATVYYPAMTGVLCWVSARYTLVFITSVNPDFPLTVPVAQGGCVVGPECIAIMMFYMAAAYAVNTLSPRLAGKVQVSTTVIKMIPLAMMAVGGVVYGLATGTLTRNFAVDAVVAGEPAGTPLLAAVCATSFAYEGWIIATVINAEIRDAKRNLPRALTIGGVIVAATYIAYYVGAAGGATNQQLIDRGATVAFTNIFGGVLGNLLNLLIVISCLGTLNGLMLACTRGIYSVAARDEGPAPRVFRQLDSETNMPVNSAVLGLLLCAAWGAYFYLANLSAAPGSWLGAFCFDSSELPVITVYLLYFPILIQWMRKSRDEKPMARFVWPCLALAGSAFMVFASIYAHGMGCLYYLIVFAVFMAAGALVQRRNERRTAGKIR